MQVDPLDEAVEWMQSRKRTWEGRRDRLDAHLRSKGAHDGPARRRRRVRDRLRHHRAQRAGVARPALGPDAGDGDGRAHDHAGGAPCPRRQDAHDPHRRAIRRRRRPCRGRLVAAFDKLATLVAR